MHELLVHHSLLLSLFGRCFFLVSILHFLMSTVLAFSETRELVNEMWLAVGHGAPRSLDPGDGKGAFCRTWW
jgi:hypothetical protein